MKEGSKDPVVEGDKVCENRRGHVETKRKREGGLKR